MKMTTVEYAQTLMKGIDSLKLARKQFGFLCSNEQLIDTVIAKVFHQLVQAENTLSTDEENVRLLASQKEIEFESQK